MKSNDTAARRLVTGIAIAVGLFAWGDSYDHVYSLARDNHGNVLSAALLPFCGEGPIILGTAMMFLCSRYDKAVPLRARIIAWGGVVITTWANLAFGLSAHDRTNAVLSVWPVVAFVGCVEGLIWMREHFWMQPAKRMRPAAVADAPLTLVTDAQSDAGPAVSITRRGRKPKTHDEIRAMMRRAEEAFPEVLRGAKIPPLRTIQSRLQTGQSYAQLVQDHFETLRAGLATA